MKVLKSNMLVIILVLLCASILHAQSESVKSNVYPWNNSKVDNKIVHESKVILEGSTTSFESLQIHSSSLQSGKLVEMKEIDVSNEVLIIIKEGELNFKIKDEEKTLGAGSLVLLYPGEEYSAKNLGDIDAVYYVMQYKSKEPVSINTELSTGNSFMIDWNDLEFKSHDKGGIRNYFEKSTAMLERFEMHVTTLNADINSHEPHTHGAEEIVLMINGDANLQIGESFYDATEGDLIFLGSNVPHALTNTGTESCMYYAFQWE